MDGTTILSLIGIILALAVLIYGIYQGITPLIVTLVSTLLVIVTSKLPLFDTYTGTFATGVGNMTKNMYLVFITATMFGVLMNKVGATSQLGNWFAAVFKPKHTILVVVIVMMLFQYGGLGFGAFIIMYSIGLRLCKRAGISKFILPGAIFCGSWAFAMTGPFAVNTMNYLIGQYLGTTPYAGLIPGLISGVLINLIGGIIYLNWQSKRWTAKGIVWAHDAELETVDQDESWSGVGVLKAILPILVVFCSYNFLKVALPMATLIGVIVVILININKFTTKEWLEHSSKGALEGVGPTLNMAAIAGFGSVVSATPFFAWFQEWLKVVDMNPYLLAILIPGILAALLSSGTNAVVLSMSTLSDFFLGYGQLGYNMGNIHRLMCMSAGILDSLPTNGSINSLMGIFKTSYKEGYFPIFVTCCVLPFFATICCYILVLIGL